MHNNQQVIHRVIHRLSTELSTVATWSEWINKIHHREIVFGLERVGIVAKRLNLLIRNTYAIIVGGTNGKGSIVRSLEKIYAAAGYRIGSFTSPFLFRLNEEIRLDCQPVSDELLCEAFQVIESHRDDILLTSFEFRTLAALWLFKQQPLDMIILEVGLGGRLDATNIIDADISIISSIDLDHTHYLGNTREKIAIEKGGIFRANQLAICGDCHPPQTLLDLVKKQGVTLFCQGRDFYWQCLSEQETWSWYSDKVTYTKLPKPGLALQNVSVAMMAVTLLQKCFPLTNQQIIGGLKEVVLPGRIEVVSNEFFTVIYDVSHNPAAVSFLALYLQKLFTKRKILAIFSMLVDKDILSSILSISSIIDYWYVAPLLVARGATLAQLKANFKQSGIKRVNYYHDLQHAYIAAKKVICQEDVLVIFGSFMTVAAIKKITGDGLLD